jgi:methylglutaconyl-CoA hydratase
VSGGREQAAADQEVLVEVDGDGTGWLVLNRPDVHNAFNDGMIARITGALGALSSDPGVRTVAIRANGRSFSAGADLVWMERLAASSRAENVADAMALARMLRTLDQMAKPTLAVVHGPAYGGGVGLIAACDIVLAARETARFALTEVRLGLTPATISPYVIAAIGQRQARRYVLTAEPFDAPEALRIGLVHQVVPAAKLDQTARSVLELLAAGGPAAQAAGKALIRSVAGRAVDEALMRETAEGIAAARASEEARERMARFFQARQKGPHRQ